MPQLKREIRVINNVEKLQCSKCKYWLVFDEFFNNKRTSTTKCSYCKVCYKSRYGTTRNVKSNSGILGIFLYECEICHLKFTSKKSNKVFCSDKCRKKDWYIRNEQTKSGATNGRKLSYKNFNTKELKTVDDKFKQLEKLSQVEIMYEFYNFIGEKKNKIIEQGGSPAEVSNHIWVQKLIDDFMGEE